MKMLRIAFKPETAAPILALVFATGISGVLVIARILWTGNVFYSFLLWNLFLAWLPLVFALLACDEQRSETRRGWRFFGFAGAWLVFFPNAPYIFTDLIHLTNRFFYHFWIDLSLILISAFTGLVIGFVSLYLMQGIVSRLYGRITSWLFVAAMAAASSFGVYLGRFMRFNSWDIFTKPGKVYDGIGSWASDSLTSPITIGFPILFAAFLFTAYLVLYALTHLSPVQHESPKLATPEFKEA